MPQGGASELYRVGDLLIDVTGASVSRHGERLVLPPRTFELLVALVRHYPCTVRRHDLLDTVWPDETVSDQTLSHRVMVLRKALGDHAEEPAYVAGERGYGYRFVAPVEPIGPAEEDPNRSAADAPPLRRRLVWGSAAAAIGIAIVAGALVAGRRAGWAPATVPASASAQQERPGREADARLERLCLRGEFFFLTLTEESLRRSAEAWEQAVTLAPRHARAHAGQAITRSVRALLELVPLAESERLAREGVRRSLELEPGSPAGQLAASLVRLAFDWDAAGAAEVARSAMRANPDDLRGPLALALALQGQGQLEASEQILQDSMLDDPDVAAIVFLTGRVHQMRARWGDAVVAYTRALELEPELVLARRGTAECLTVAGRPSRALLALGAIGPDSDAPGDQLHAAWRRLCVGGRMSGETLRACVLGGELERAERLLAAAVEGRRPFVVFVPAEALLQPLHSGPAMRTLIARLRQPPRPLSGP